MSPSEVREREMKDARFDVEKNAGRQNGAGEKEGRRRDRVREGARRLRTAWREGEGRLGI